MITFTKNETRRSVFTNKFACVYRLSTFISVKQVGNQKKSQNRKTKIALEKTLLSCLLFQIVTINVALVRCSSKGEII